MELTAAAEKIYQRELAPVFEIHDPKPVTKFIKPEWWDHLEPINGKKTYGRNCRQVVKDFVTGQLARRVRVGAGNGNHVYYTKNEGQELWMLKDNKLKVRICIARKVNGAFVGNASGLMAMRPQGGKKINWGGGRSKIQESLQDVMPMVPFRMFEENRLDLNSFEIIDRAADEWIETDNTRDPRRHFMGAMVFKMKIRTRSQGLVGHVDEYFLFDVDRNDVALKQFNPFLSKLPKAVASIGEAYDLLKPQEVRDAERFGAKIERQGEWFFIPIQGESKRATDDNAFRAHSRGGRRPYAQAVLQSKGNRAHFVEQLSEDGYVRGKVTHGGHEHKPIDLKGWHKAVPNTAIGSFKISGAID